MSKAVCVCFYLLFYFFVIHIEKRSVSVCTLIFKGISPPPADPHKIIIIINMVLCQGFWYELWGERGATFIS